MSFTPRQQFGYRALVKRAWQAHAMRSRLDPESAYDRDWYAAQLQECLGVSSTAQANKIEDYDRACLHFAEIAGDDTAIGYFTAAVERRVVYWIKRRMADLSYIERQAVDWPYVRAIYSQMHLPLTMEEAPAQLLLKVFQALDTHVRRLRRRAKIRAFRDSESLPDSQIIENRYP